MHAITKPGDELFHSPHDGGYGGTAPQGPNPRPCFIAEHEFGRLSTRCTCTLGLNMSQRVDRMLKVRSDVRDIAVYRMGVGCDHI